MTKKQRAAMQKKRQQKKIALVAVEILVLLLLAVVLFIVVKLSKIEKDNSFSAEDIEVNEGISQESQEIMEGYTTIALFGLDNRSNGNLSKGNSDVIMIASINNDTHDVKLVSVYRDSYLDIGNGKYQKCNSAYASGGPEQAISMLNRNLDLNITDYVTVDFNAVVECVDLLGGVELTVTDEEACAYARIRYTAGDDYKRTERQRIVLAAMVEKAQKSDIKTLNSLIDEVFGDIKTSFSNADLIALATKMFEYSLGETTGFPFEKNTITLGSKGSVVVPCDLKTNVKQLHVFLYDDQDYEPTDTVKSNSEEIISDTGFHQGDGY